jgi:hypothetical protein
MRYGISDDAFNYLHYILVTRNALHGSLLLPNYHFLLKLSAITVLLPHVERIEVVAFVTAAMVTIHP